MNPDIFLLGNGEGVALVTGSVFKEEEKNQGRIRKKNNGTKPQPSQLIGEGNDRTSRLVEF